MSLTLTAKIYLSNAHNKLGNFLTHKYFIICTIQIRNHTIHFIKHHLCPAVMTITFSVARYNIHLFSASAMDHNTIGLVWTKPININGNLKWYLISIYEEPDDIEIPKKRDYCVNPFR